MLYNVDAIRTDGGCWQQLFSPKYIEGTVYKVRQQYLFRFVGVSAGIKKYLKCCHLKKPKYYKFRKGHSFPNCSASLEKLIQLQILLHVYIEVNRGISSSRTSQDEFLPDFNLLSTSRLTHRVLLLTTTLPISNKRCLKSYGVVHTVISKHQRPYLHIDHVPVLGF